MQISSRPSAIWSIARSGKLPSSRGEGDAVTVAHEKLAPQLLLKAADSGADRRLREVQPARRDREAAMCRDFQETAQILSVHAFCPQTHCHRKFRWPRSKNIAFRSQSTMT